MVPELYTPLVHLESVEAERPISPPGRTTKGFVLLPKFIWALKLFFLLVVKSLIFVDVTVSSVLIPGLNTVIIPKLPLDSTSIVLWLSAFINTLPLDELTSDFSTLTKSFPFTVSNLLQWGVQLWGSSGFSCIPALCGAFKEIFPVLIIYDIVLLNDASTLEKPKAICWLFVVVLVSSLYFPSIKPLFTILANTFGVAAEPCKSIPIFLLLYKLIVPVILNSELFFGSSITIALASATLTFIVELGKETFPVAALRVKKFLKFFVTVFTS